MFYLPPLTTANEDIYYKMVSPRVVKALSVSTLSPNAKAFLNTARIKSIICDQPKDLLNHHNDLLPELSPGFTPAIYDDYLEAQKKLKARKTRLDKRLIRIYKPILAALSAVFNYNKFISAHKVTSYNLAKILDCNTCTYCNRLYTTTILGNGRLNNSKRIARPNYDHWYSHSKYPILSLSIYNLIPSCTVCNSSIKGSVDFSLTNFVHPYDNVATQDFSFDYKYQNIHVNNVTINVLAKSKMANTLNAFKIQEVYNEHSAFELKDLLELRYKYSENYLDTLFNKTFKLPVGEKEAYRMIFGTEYEDVDHRKRPFSKFKKDILEKLGVNF